MLRDRSCFVLHFLICLALVVAAFYAWRLGYPQDVWKTDISYMTSVTVVLVIWAMLDLGRQAWSVTKVTHPHMGVLIVGLCPLIGLLGTSTGLRANVATLAEGASGLVPLATAVETMQVGVGGLIVVLIMMFNLEEGARRALH